MLLLLVLLLLLLCAARGSMSRMVRLRFVGLVARSLEDISKRYAVVSDRLMAIDASTAESRASSILSGLQFSREMQGMPSKALSGGWRMRYDNEATTAIFMSTLCVQFFLHPPLCVVALMVSCCLSLHRRPLSLIQFRVSSRMCVC